LFILDFLPHGFSAPTPAATHLQADAAGEVLDPSQRQKLDRRDDIEAELESAIKKAKEQNVLVRPTSAIPIPAPSRRA
jgi:hypothetical protein